MSVFGVPWAVPDIYLMADGIAELASRRLSARFELRSLLIPSTGTELDLITVSPETDTERHT